LEAAAGVEPALTRTTLEGPATREFFVRHRLKLVKELDPAIYHKKAAMSIVAGVEEETE
jgi:hypothetical protein